MKRQILCECGAVIGELETIRIADDGGEEVVLVCPYCIERAIESGMEAP